LSLKTNQKIITEDQAYIYQLVESTLKLNLDTRTSIECINLVLEHTKDLYIPKNSRIDMEKMNRLNYLKHVRNIKLKYSEKHRKIKENKYYSYRNPVNIQLEKLLFNAIDKPVYHQLKAVDTDDLIERALIHIKGPRLL